MSWFFLACHSPMPMDIRNVVYTSSLAYQKKTHFKGYSEDDNLSRGNIYIYISAFPVLLYCIPDDWPSSKKRNSISVKDRLFLKKFVVCPVACGQTSRRMKKKMTSCPLNLKIGRVPSSSYGMMAQYQNPDLNIGSTLGVWGCMQVEIIGNFSNKRKLARSTPICIMYVCTRYPRSK